MRQANFADAEALLEEAETKHSAQLTRENRARLKRYRHKCRELMDRTIVREALEAIDFDEMDMESEEQARKQAEEEARKEA